MIYAPLKSVPTKPNTTLPTTHCTQSKYHRSTKWGQIDINQAMHAMNTENEEEEKAEKTSCISM